MTSAIPPINAAPLAPMAVRLSIIDNPPAFPLAKLR
jgi:hypothetical protein